MTRLLMVLFAVTSCFAGGKAFQSLSLEEALVRAQAEHKLVFIDFFTEWCGPCKVMERTTFRDEQVLSWLDQHAIALAFDAEKNTELATRFAVVRYPTLIFLKPDGSIALRDEGGRNAGDFLRLGNLALEGKSLLQAAQEDVAAHPEQVSLRVELAERLIDAKDPEQATSLLVQVLSEKQSGQHSSLSLRYLYQTLNYCGTPAAASSLNAQYESYRQLMLNGQASERDIEDMAALVQMTHRSCLPLYEDLKRAGVNLEPLRHFDPYLLRELMSAGRYEEANALQSVEQRLAGLNAQIEATKNLPADRQDLEISFLLRLKRQLFGLLLGLKRHDQAMQLALEILDQRSNPAVLDDLASIAFDHQFVNATVIAWAKQAYEEEVEHKMECLATYASVMALAGQVKQGVELVEKSLQTAVDEDRQILSHVLVNLRNLQK